MNDILAILTTYQFVLLCGGIVSMTFVARTIVEFFWLNNPNLPGNRDNRFFKSLFLPLFPIVLGVLFGIFGKGFPDLVITSQQKFLFGSTGGLLAPILFQVIKGMLWNFVPQQVQTFISNLGTLGLGLNQNNANGTQNNGVNIVNNIDVSDAPPNPLIIQNPGVSSPVISAPVISIPSSSDTVPPPQATPPRP